MYRHFDVSKDKNGNEVGVEFKEMTADGSKVFFTTEKQMTRDDTDTSRDLYVWSEAAARAETSADPGLRQRQPSGQQRQLRGQLDTEMRRQGDITTAETLFDPRIAKESGEIYFYSPEQLDGARGVPNKRNLYV